MGTDPFKDQVEYAELRTLRWNIAGIACALWVISLFLTAYGDTPGFACLLFGWAMIADDTFAFVAWTGNILAGVAWLILLSGRMKSTYKLGLLFAVAAVVFSLGALRGIPVPTQNLTATETESPDIGVFVWFISELLVMVGSAVAYSRTKE